MMNSSGLRKNRFKRLFEFLVHLIILLYLTASEGEFNGFHKQYPQTFSYLQPL